MSLYIGEALFGDGDEIAHIDLLIGSKTGPVGTAFANALANQSHGHTNLLAVIAPNLVCKPATVLITKVTIKGLGQAVQMFGPAQAAVGRASPTVSRTARFPRPRPTTWSSCAECSSTRLPRMTTRSTSTTMKRP